MKHGKKLKLKQKKFLSAQGMDPKEFLFIKQNMDNYVYLHVPTGKEILIRR